MFYDQNKERYWDGSFIRKWLNGIFLQKSFDNAERVRIVKKEIRSETNSISGYNITMDNIFLLSKEEANLYFKSKEDRRLEPTEFVLKDSNGYRISFDSKFGKWWLRDTGGRPNQAAYVHVTGFINTSGEDVTSSSVLVRPALWVKKPDRSVE